MTQVNIGLDWESDNSPDWQPQSPARGLANGTRRYGSTGQLFEARDGRWVRIKKSEAIGDHA